MVKQPTRTARVMVKMTPAEKENLEKLAQNLGLTVSAYIRFLVSNAGSTSN